MWKSITDDEMTLCQQMVRWLEIRKKWQPEEPWLPTEADISKSALFERLRSGGEPLEFPPPIGLACPWYAVVEDPRPHYIGTGRNDIYINCKWDDPIFGPEGSWLKAGEVQLIQHTYRIVERRTETEVIVADGWRETPYRFRLWLDPDHDPKFHHKPGIRGGWFIQNVEFAGSVSDVAKSDGS